jgi:hypothetical protein
MLTKNTKLTNIVESLLPFGPGRPRTGKQLLPASTVAPPPVEALIFSSTGAIVPLLENCSTTGEFRKTHFARYT